MDETVRGNFHGMLFGIVYVTHLFLNAFGYFAHFSVFLFNVTAR